ncbi:hypothetical protein KSF73_06420 [Burkholderiaceae bacterium DAT-1]|nr:hypothetical protein [Burkholderiaceae bacterium DAT-1]
MRIFHLLFCVALLTVSHADELSPGVLASGQRVLIERMARLYMWQALQPQQKEPAERLGKTIKQFDSQLATLERQVHKDVELSDQVALLKDQWPAYRMALAAAVSPKASQKVLEESENLAWLAQSGTKLIEQKKLGASRGIQLTEGIAAASQRLAKQYLAQVGGVKTAFLPKDLQAARSEFEQSMKDLRALYAGNSKLLEQIQLMEDQWLFFQRALDALGQKMHDQELVSNVIVTSEHILEVTDTLVGKILFLQGQNK